MEKKLHTLLPLMIQPHLPRFLYQGDQVVIKSRISNLDSTLLTGKVSCTVEDALTGEDLTAESLTRLPVEFRVAGNSSVAAGVSLRAMTGELADAESQIIPVLSPKILISRYHTFRFSSIAAADTLVALPALPAGDSLYGIGLSINTRPQAALIHSLPWLANYSFDCAEQTFNKMQADQTAVGLMRSDKELQQAYAGAVQRGAMGNGGAGAIRSEAAGGESGAGHADHRGTFVEALCFTEPRWRALLVRRGEE